ncbi:MAG TPA: YbbR-like domain-containing protein [Flavobacteriaceae bacterium]|nr:YbbR-like domain-containing protein [Flavobacteriaceae bacterium]
MISDLKKIAHPRFKRTNFKAFSFFLGFSLLIWILVQFSKTYQEAVRIPVEYSQIPKDKIIDDKPVFLDIRLEESGFRIAWFSLFKNDLKIDLTKLDSNGEELVYNVENHSQEIRQQLDLNPEEVVFMEETLKIPYQQKTVKTVPVLSQIQVDFQPGYASNDSLRISPDSITISGAKNKVDSIKSLKTIYLELKKVNGPVSGSIAIDTSGIGEITFYENKVNYSLQVEKFTEGKIQVPINVTNAPEGMEITIFPKTLTVIFKVSLENYKDISKSDFRVVCDYRELEEGQSFFIPKVLKKPEKITQLRLNVNKVQFVVQK